MVKIIYFKYLLTTEKKLVPSNFNEILSQTGDLNPSILLSSFSEFLQIKGRSFESKQLNENSLNFHKNKFICPHPEKKLTFSNFKTKSNFIKNFKSEKSNYFYETIFTNYFKKLKTCYGHKKLTNEIIEEEYDEINCLIIFFIKLFI